MTWIFLLVLGLLGVQFLAGAGALSLTVLPVVAVATDLAFQSVRFPTVRFPDGALATGLFLALLATPTVPLVAAGTVTFAAIGLKHALRYRGRPVLNPAASGLVAGVFLFGMAPAWWAGVGPWGNEVLVALGVGLVLRSLTSWRLAATFFVVYAPFSVAMKVIVGAALAPKLLVLGVLDPATLFFGLFMVVEPRTAPADPLLHPLYAAMVAFGAVFLPLAMPGPGVLVALLLTNLGAVAFRVARDVRSASKASVGAFQPARRSRNGRRRQLRRDPPRAPAWPPWSIGRRLTSGFLVLIVIGAVAAVTYAPSPTPSVSAGVPPHFPGGGGGSSSGSGGSGSHVAASCVKDSPAVPSGTLQALHRALGPSVILSYDPSTGTTVFYDPVNSVTVTETDLYEDYGFAEFNGDDFAVSGCSP
ncbi:MAG: hypothetical protein L3J95_00165 [Thermoplasmata archaeon]|nr:hypothetical protein [Thermoplasmata archaeon]MCI4358835.1 hypothetical protein [Thermoplasmata archaeon]